MTLTAEAMKSRRAAYSEQQQDAERARVREKHAKFSTKEAAAATQRNTNRRRRLEPVCPSPIDIPTNGVTGPPRIFQIFRQNWLGKWEMQ